MMLTDGLTLAAKSMNQTQTQEEEKKVILLEHRCVFLPRCAVFLHLA